MKKIADMLEILVIDKKWVRGCSRLVNRSDHLACYIALVPRFGSCQPTSAVILAVFDALVQNISVPQYRRSDIKSYNEHNFWLWKTLTYFLWVL